MNKFFPPNSSDDLCLSSVFILLPSVTEKDRIVNYNCSCFDTTQNSTLNVFQASVSGKLGKRCMFYVGYWGIHVNTVHCSRYWTNYSYVYFYINTWLTNRFIINNLASVFPAMSGKETHNLLQSTHLTVLHNVHTYYVRSQWSMIRHSQGLGILIE